MTQIATSTAFSQFSISALACDSTFNAGTFTRFQISLSDTLHFQSCRLFIPEGNDPIIRAHPVDTELQEASIRQIHHVEDDPTIRTDLGVRISLSQRRKKDVIDKSIELSRTPWFH